MEKGTNILISSRGFMDNGWAEWGKHVLAELKRLNEACEGLEKGNIKIREDLAGLKVKSGLWGASAGAIPVVIMVLWKMIRG